MYRIAIIMVAVMFVGMSQPLNLSAGQDTPLGANRRKTEAEANNIRRMDVKIEAFLKKLDKKKTAELESMLHDFTKASERGGDAQDKQVQAIAKTFPQIKDLAGVPDDPLAKGGKGWKTFVKWLKRIVHKCTD